MPADPKYQRIEEDTRKLNIEAFWTDFDARIAFLDELVKQGRYPEAMTLCATYLDGVALYLAGKGAKNGASFSEAMAKYEQRPYFSLVHPLQLARSAKELGGVWPSIASKIEKVFAGPTYKLLSIPDFLVAVKGHLSPAELGELKANVWRATLGAVVYYWIRNPSVHRLGSSATISFSQSTYEGQTVSAIGLHELVPVLKAMSRAARAQSLAEGTLP